MIQINTIKQDSYSMWWYTMTRKYVVRSIKKWKWDFPGGPVVKNPPSKAGGEGLIPGRGTNIHWKDGCWSSNTLVTWCKERIHWKTPWCWERLRAGREGGDRGWDGWRASPTQWTWAWANSRRQWRTGKPPCMLQSMGWQRVRHSLVTQQQGN